MVRSARWSPYVLAAAATLVAAPALAGLAAAEEPVALAPVTASAPCADLSVVAGSSPAGYFPLSQFGHPPLSLEDDGIVSVDVPPFRYAGEVHTVIHVSADGYVQVGGTAVRPVPAQALPDPTEPNGVLAPYWTDLDPSAGGAVRVEAVSPVPDPDGEVDWIVVEWDTVPETSMPGNTHSFQLWLTTTSRGSDVHYFTYGAGSRNGAGGRVTVGAEGPNGRRGSIFFHDGTGRLPTEGTSLVVNGTASLEAAFTAAPTPGDESLDVAFDASASTGAGPGAGYVWDFGDGTTGSGMTVSHSYTTAGDYTATLTVTDDAGRSCSASQQVTSSGAGPAAPG